MKRAQKVQPIERFPAKPRHDGRFQKRIRGILYYFGRDGDRKAALSEYDAAKVDLYAGRRPRADAIATAGELTVKEIGNRFLADKKPDIQPDTYRGYKRAIKRFVKRIGVARIWNDLTPDDFSTHGRYLRVTLKLANASYNIERAGILAMFNHAEAQDWIDRAPKFGNSFRRVPKSKMRTTRAKKLLSFEEIAALLSVCSADLFGMILLGLNGGFGASDCTSFPAAKWILPRAWFTSRGQRTTFPAPLLSGLKRSPPCACCARLGQMTISSFGQSTETPGTSPQ